MTEDMRKMLDPFEQKAEIGKQSDVNKKILIIDNESTKTQEFLTHFSNLAYRVEYAETGHAALRKLNSNAKYDLIFLDTSLQDMSGFKILESIRAYQPDAFKVMLTPNQQLDMGIEAIKQGADHFMMKPLQHGQVTKLLKNVFHHEEMFPSLNTSSIVACIPAYNEEARIAKVILQAQSYVDHVVVCDDGSTDLTAEIAQKLGAEVIRHEINKGYGAAIQTLFSKGRELNADIMITLDADGQHNPHEIPILLDEIINNGVDVAMGSRYLQKGLENSSFYRRFGVKLITKLTGFAMNTKISDAQHGFRAYNRKAIQNLQLLENGMGVSIELIKNIKDLNLSIAEVPITIEYEGLETSTKNPVSHGFEVILTLFRLIFEERPLLFLGIPGLIFLLIGVFFGGWMLQIFTVEGSLNLSIALATMAFSIIGFLTISTSITLYAIIRLTQKIREN